ncbi:efflux RND transporter periplasmic adaptor subunit [Sphingomonas sp. MMS24-JH45]
MMLPILFRTPGRGCRDRRLGGGCRAGCGRSRRRGTTSLGPDAQAAPRGAVPLLAIDMAGRPRRCCGRARRQGGRAWPNGQAHGVVKSGAGGGDRQPHDRAGDRVLLYEPGQSFGKGAILASFDCSQMKAQLAAADAATAAYRKTYDTNVELDQYKAIGTNEVAVSKANLGKASAEALAIRAGVGQCSIAAPFAGTVAERPAHEHHVAAPGQPLMKIQGNGDLEVELIVPSAWLTWVKPGTPFTFAIDETGGSVTGRIARLGAAVDPASKTMRVTGSIVVQGVVLPGMSGTARFAQGGSSVSAIDDLVRPPAHPSGRRRVADGGALMGWEAELRRQPKPARTALFRWRNETDGVLDYDQAFMLQRPLVGDGWRIEIASGLAAVDRNAPLVRAIEAAIAEVELPWCDLDAPEDAALDDYPFRHWLWYRWPAGKAAPSPGSCWRARTRSASWTRRGSSGWPRQPSTPGSR